ncbi:DUF4625 domain-containing protein [Sphingobacterium sp.]|uniref:DUF4625 domain-containing protein n=1 Tax=Sphingobacterium sp. TaxID=341027 RepID=UPI0028A02A2D|nr:DUF4625 domain-containing protein [Sphingobacterium sp.]
MKKNKLMLVMFLIVTCFTACKKDNENPGQDTENLPKPKMENLEIGIGNNELGVIGQDLHFNVDVLAGDKIDFVEAKIVQRDNETYKSKWNFTKKWEQYKGAKNTNIHSHFDIPLDAVEGIYDFFVIAHDENGTKTEIKRKITIWSKESLPINPTFYTFNVSLNGDFQASTIKKGQPIYMVSRIDYVKDDGKMYILLINKKHNHKPETIQAIDFSKAIVYDMREHKGMKNTGQTGNVDPLPSQFIIGTDKDPFGNPITGEKSWESGTYYAAIIYTNTTHNMSIFEYKEIKIEMN